MEIGPRCGYFPEETKSILIVKQDDAERAKLFCTENKLNFKVKHGHRYLGGCVGEKDLESTWLKEKVTTWMEAVDSISKLAPRASQSALVGVQMSLQHELTFV